MKVITIGRITENNDIVINDEKVSRSHLQMIMDDNGNYSVIDLDSTNGTYVNGQRISGEVRLQPCDEVRIGQTVLPWKNYFATPIVDSQLTSRPPKGPNRTWLYVIIGVALLLLIGGGVAWKIYYDKQKEKIEQEEEKKEQEERQLEQEVSDARVEAARLSEEYEAAARKAAETKSEKDKAIANEMKAKAEEASRLAQQKEAQWKEMNAELEAAKKAKKEAEDKSAEDAKIKEEAEKEAEAAKNAAKKAEEDRKYAEEETRLTKVFYGLIYAIKPKKYAWDTDYYQEICDKNKWTVDKKTDKKAFIIEKFEKADNSGKGRIIHVIKEVISIESAAQKVGDTVAQSASAATDTIE